MRSTTRYLCIRQRVVAGLKNLWCKDLQILDVLEAVSEVAEERMVKVLKHASLANNVPDALRFHHCYTTSARLFLSLRVCLRTFVLADILEGVGAAIVLPLHDADLTKGTLAYDAKETEVVKVYCSREAVSTSNSRLSCIWRTGRTLIGKDYRLALLVAHVSGRLLTQACSDFPRQVVDGEETSVQVEEVSEQERGRLWVDATSTQQA
jgi:hypothetical protein